MAMTDAEKEAKILEIGELCSEISRTNQLLLDIFRAGGVPNPNWAVMKAELQGWTTTQLGDYVKLSGDNNYISGVQIFPVGNSSIVFKDNSVDKTNLTASINRSGSIGLRDKNNKGICALNLCTQTSASSQYLPKAFFSIHNEDTTEAAFAGAAGFKDENDIFRVALYSSSAYPYLSDADWSKFSADMIPNFGWLHNTGNFLVHKFGEESIKGLKTFYNPFGSGNKIWNMHIKNGYFRNYNNNEQQDGVYSDITFLGEEDTVLGQIGMSNDASYNRRVFLYVLNKSQSGEVLQNTLSLQCNKSGTRSCLIESEVKAKGTVYPQVSNTYSCGAPSALWTNVYASNGTIQTSDKNLKTEISDIPTTVFNAWGKVKFQQFKMKDSVNTKGTNARIHIGVIANELAHSIEKAFQSEGLDAHKYGLFCYDEWEDIYDDEYVLVKPEVRGQVKVIDSEAIYDFVQKEDGSFEKVLTYPEKYHMEEGIIEEAVFETRKKLIQPAGSRYSVRYEECLALECAYQRWVLKKIADKVGITI